MVKKEKAKKEKKVKEKLDVSFWSLVLKLSLIFVILLSITGIVLSAVLPINFSFDPYKSAYKISDETALKWFKNKLNSNFDFKVSTYKKDGLFLSKHQEESLIADFNNGVDISNIDEIQQLADFLDLDYVSGDILYQDQIVNSSIRLQSIIIDSIKSEEDGRHSYGDVSLEKETNTYSVTAHHVYLVCLMLKNGNKDEKIVNLKKYLTFNQTRTNLDFKDLIQLSGLSLPDSENAVVDQIYQTFFENIPASSVSHQTGNTFYFDSEKFKKVNEIKDFFRLNTKGKENLKLWNQLNNLGLSINIISSSEEIIAGASGDSLISSNYEGDDHGKPSTNNSYKFEYRFDFEVEGIKKPLHYIFVPKPFVKPPPNDK